MLRTLLTQFSGLLEENIGLHFAANDFLSLEAKAEKLTQLLHFPSVTACIDHLCHGQLNEKEIDAIVSLFTIGESSFFRDKFQFQAFEELLLKQKIDQPLKIWSCGCAQGEETYSIAFLLTRKFPHLNVRIIGSDINKQFLQNAKSGIYRKWAFRNSPNFFSTMPVKKIDEDHWEVLPHIREKVYFIEYNVIHPPSALFSKTDIIFCSNLLIYLTPRKIKLAVEHLVESLNDEGYLFVSAVDIPLITHPKLKTITIGESLLLQKSNEKPAIQPPPKICEPTVATLLQKIVDEANQGYIKSALNYCKQGLELTSQSPELFYLYASVQQELGNDLEAILALQRALVLNQNFIAAHFNLGNLLLRQNRAADARSHFEKTLKLLHTHSSEESIPWAPSFSNKILTQIVIQLRDIAKDQSHESPQI